MAVKMTALDVVDALRHDYITGEMVQEEWSLLTEVPLNEHVHVLGVAGGYLRRHERTIDVLLLRNWGGVRSESFERLAIEIKVTKSDYRNETDEKRSPAWANAHRCAYACPEGIITAEDLPPGWGLLWVYPEPITGVPPTSRDWHRRCVWKRGAKRHDVDGDPVRLLHNIARRAARAEERIRLGDGDPAELARLRIEVERLHARLANRDAAIDRQRQRANEALKRLRARGPQICADCREPVKAETHRRSFAFSEDGFWRHTDDDVGKRCRMKRSEAVRVSRETATATRYSPHRDYAAPIETADERAEREAEAVAIRAEEDAYRALTTDDDHREEANYG
jgi:hypothetical protein